MVMQPHERLKHVRIASGETLDAVAHRIGVAPRLLSAIDDGRFDDLPRGIYARAAIRSYATGLGLDAAEILAACEPLLPGIADPIDAMCRLRGVRVSPARENAADPLSIADAPRPDWRVVAAVALDALVIGAMLIVLIASAAILARVPLRALGGSAAAFALMGVLLGSSYFLWLGGLSGATAGERGIGLRSTDESMHALNLRAVAIRALCCATNDLRFIRGLGMWLGRLSAAAAKGEIAAADASNDPRAIVARG
jgi:hypothetical protein